MLLLMSGPIAILVTVALVVAAKGLTGWVDRDKRAKGEESTVRAGRWAAVFGLGVLLVAGGVLFTSQIVAVDPQDIQIDVSRVGEEPCNYWVGDWRHYGFESEVVVDDPSAVGSYLACTDWPEVGVPSCQTPECFLQGEHYIMLEAADPPAPVGCIHYNVKGIRGAAVSSKINGKPQPLRYLASWDGWVESVCGLGAGEQIELRLMMCPDLNGDHTIDLFSDIFGTAVVAGYSRGEPGWNPLADHNEDFTVDLFNDIFAVMLRFGLDCDDFDY